MMQRFETRLIEDREEFGGRYVKFTCARGGGGGVLPKTFNTLLIR